MKNHHRFLNNVKLLNSINRHIRIQRLYRIDPFKSNNIKEKTITNTNSNIINRSITVLFSRFDLDYLYSETMKQNLTNNKLINKIDFSFFSKCEHGLK